MACGRRLLASHTSSATTSSVAASWSIRPQPTCLRSAVRLRATLGPDGVTYYEHVPGETLDYQPPGILLPPTCPRGGFPFAAQFNFVDGSHASARTVDPCPAKVARRGRRR
jgi:hypothetical protein